MPAAYFAPRIELLITRLSEITVPVPALPTIPPAWPLLLPVAKSSVTVEPSTVLPRTVAPEAVAAIAPARLVPTEFVTARSARVRPVTVPPTSSTKNPAPGLPAAVIARSRTVRPPPSKMPENFAKGVKDPPL
ncbi:hypothetical protein [Leucobacter soli]|uniref:hypothetical protein n=1 Tax=Leucobacter soli TaxID=2812850 RepID=UPI00360D75C8